MVDWDLIQTWVIGSALCALVVGFIFMVCARLLFYEFIAHPSVQAMTRAANKLTGSGGKGLIETAGKKILEGLFG